MATIDRSVDGEEIEAVAMHFQGLATAHDGDSPTIILYMELGGTMFPVSICKGCASMLLDCLLTVKDNHPNHFAEPA